MCPCHARSKIDVVPVVVAIDAVAVTAVLIIFFSKQEHLCIFMAVVVLQLTRSNYIQPN
jgi:hypothetical protein